MISSGSAERRGITWGVDGFGVRRYVCANCEKFLGLCGDTAKCLACDRAREKAALIGTRYGGGSGLPCGEVSTEEAAKAVKLYKARYTDKRYRK